MDMLTFLVAALVLTLILIIGLFIFLRRTQNRRLSRQVVATITKIEVEATSLSSGWVVTARWSDMQTGQTVTFRSHRLHFPPRHRNGELVTVYVDPRNPTHYRMEL